MNRQQFISHFITTFCATWCANNHADYCQMDKHDELESPPMEDALLLAEAAWELYKEHCREFAHV